jgi:hypothetical protein
MPRCSVPGCANDAAVEVRLRDKYADGTEFDEQDFTCPFLCEVHKEENERRAEGSKEPRDITDYPYTNQHGAQGWSAYRGLGGTV